MKVKWQILAVASMLCGSLLTAIGPRIEGGPKGERILEKTEPKAEFFVEKDRTVSITFYDSAMKPVPPSEQSVTVIADTKGGKQKLEFERNGDALVSKTKMPEGDGYNLVVQVKQRADAKPQNYRFKYGAYLWRLPASGIRLHV